MAHEIIDVTGDFTHLPVSKKPLQEILDGAHRNDMYHGIFALMLLQEQGASVLPAAASANDDIVDFRSAALGAFVELGELVNECQWKPWRKYEEQTDEQYAKMLDELADVLHFLGWMLNNMKRRHGLSAVDVADAFMKKHHENKARFAGLVPGREPPTDKCSGCGRVDFYGGDNEVCVDCSH